MIFETRKNIYAANLLLMAIYLLAVNLVPIFGQVHNNIASIRGPSYVCKPNCGYYATIGDYESFSNDRCCSFIQCPYGPEYDKYLYRQFRCEVCSSTPRV